MSTGLGGHQLLSKNSHGVSFQSCRLRAEPCAGFCDCTLPPPQAIESFALMVKQTAQMLQAFGTELAETELPNDVQSTNVVLSAHTEKKAKVKVSTAVGLRFGAGRAI